MYGWENSSRFLSHEPCPRCGSKDNLARYEGGSAFCFGCAYWEHGTGTGRIHQLASERPVESDNVLRPPPDDTDLGGYPPAVIEWIQKYGLTVRDLIFRDVGWSKKREQLIYQFYGDGTAGFLWQARNFKAGKTHDKRFFTGGTPADVIAAYYSRKSTDTGCIVE